MCWIIELHDCNTFVHQTFLPFRVLQVMGRGASRCSKSAMDRCITPVVPISSRWPRSCAVGSTSGSVLTPRGAVLTENPFRQVPPRLTLQPAWPPQPASLASSPASWCVKRFGQVRFAACRVPYVKSASSIPVNVCMAEKRQHNVTNPAHL